MRLSPSDVSLIADYARKATKARDFESVIGQTFKVLKSIVDMREMRIVYSPAPSRWKEWSASVKSMEVCDHDEWKVPSRKALTVLFDPENLRAGYVSVVAPSDKARSALEILAPEIWSALVLQSALQRIQTAALSEAELVRETLRARDAERRHISRELHDDLGSSMASLQLALKWVEDRIPSGKGTQEIVQTLSETRENIGLMISKIRDLSHTLYPRILDTLGLVAAVKELAYQSSRHSGMVIDCTSRGKRRHLNKGASVGLYRCCQEAVNNAIRHSQASTVRIEVHFAKEEIRVAVEDDGKGFDPKTLYDSGARMMSSGFWTIRQRMADLKGAFRVSTAGHGTVVEFIVPYSIKRTNARQQNKTADRR